jgi:hypothetical protein
VKKKVIDVLFKSRKSQITVFIILGILIILSVSIYFFIRSVSVEKALTPIPVLQAVPNELAPISAYTEECIYSTAKEAVVKLGQQGGYISPDEFGIRTSAVIPTESDGIQFSQDSQLKIPYWWYLKAPNNCARNCLFSSQRPSVKRTTGISSDSSIETQIDNYVKENLRLCLNNYQPFLAQGFKIEEKGDIAVTTIISDNDIGVYVEYPLAITLGNSSLKISQFYTSLPVNLYRIYNLATEITNAELNYTFLESQTLNLITQFAALDPESLPPKTETTFDYGGGIIWAVATVKKSIESMLMAYVPGLQVPFTVGYERRSFPDDPLRESVYAMEIPVNLDKKYQELSVRFDYLGWWPIYFSAGEGGVIRPESVSALFIPFGVQRYSTTYDISYPVVVTVSDPTAFNGEGYDFMFALESNIRNNEPIDESFTGLEGISMFQPSLLCNENQKNSGNIILKIRDAVAKSPVEGVQIAYTCGQDTCFVGKTNANGVLLSKFPVCVNGIISYLNQDYFTPAQLLTTSLDEDQDLTAVDSYPYIEKKVDAMKYLYSTQFNQLALNSMNLDQNEKALISLTRVKETPGDDDFLATAEVYGNQTTSSTMRLIPGKYELNINIIKQESLLIPAEKRKVDAGFFGALVGAQNEVEIPEVKVDGSYVSGGAEFTEQTGYFIIQPSSLYDNSKIVFNAIGFSTPKKVEDMAEIGNVADYSTRFRQQLEPAYIK